MRRLTSTLLASLALFVLVPAGVAQAPNVFRMRVNDAAELGGASVRCVARQPGLLTCGGSNSKIFVQFTRQDVYVFKATGPSSIFKLLYRVER